MGVPVGSSTTTEQHCHVQRRTGRNRFFQMCEISQMCEQMCKIFCTDGCAVLSEVQRQGRSCQIPDTGPVELTIAGVV